MTRKKLIVFISFLLVIPLCGICLYATKSYNSDIIISNRNYKMANGSTLSMMFETEAGSGEYVATDDTTWPTDGYVFNATLSGCENGSALRWDDENKKVIVEANTSDKCYVYFDVAETTVDRAPTIANVVNTTSTTTTATVEVTTSDNTLDVVTYYYKLSTAKDWASTTVNSYTFGDLEENSEYQIDVKVEDVNGVESEIFTTTIKTTINDAEV